MTSNAESRTRPVRGREGRDYRAKTPAPALTGIHRNGDETMINKHDPEICPVHGKQWHHSGTAADGREMYVCKYGCGEFRGKPSRMNRPNVLGFEICRTDDDVLIRSSEDTEWTSGVVWARSAPETVVTMLADLWDALEELKASC